MEINQSYINRVLKNTVEMDPIISGVYFLYYEDELVYIGISCNIGSRITQHKNKLFNKVCIYETSSFREAAQIEDFLLKQSLPKYNKTRIGLVSYNKAIFKDKFDLNKCPERKGWLED